MEKYVLEDFMQIKGNSKDQPKEELKDEKFR